MGGLFGSIPNRDIVDLIYRLIHKYNTKLLIIQYEETRWIGEVDLDDVGYCMKMVDKNISDDYFMFNYRVFNDPFFIDKRIYRYDATDFSEGELKSNYWYSSGKSSPRGYK